MSESRRPRRWSGSPDERSTAVGGDPGLQPERTSLAWRRTGLAASTAAAAMVRVAVLRDAPMVAALCAGLFVISLGAFLEGSSRSAARRPRCPQGSCPA